MRYTMYLLNIYGVTQYVIYTHIRNVYYYSITKRNRVIELV
jgi:hypothetical protein